MLDRLFHDHYGSRFIFVGDALYANAPMIRRVETAGLRYLCRVKSSQRKRLFEQVAAAATTPWHVMSHPAKGVLQWRVRRHRYGHERHNLSAILAMLMDLAGAIDQIQMRWRPRFQRDRALAGALYQLWHRLMQVVQMFAFASWEQFDDLIAGDIAPQLVGPLPDT